MLSGVAIMAAGAWLLTRMDHTATQTQLTVAMVVFGIGLGMAMQLYTLVVQNAASARDMGWPPPRRSSSAASGRRSASPSWGP